MVMTNGHLISFSVIIFPLLSFLRRRMKEWEASWRNLIFNLPIVQAKNVYDDIHKSVGIQKFFNFCGQSF